MTQTQTDESLYQSIQMDDSVAFEAFFKKYYQALVGFANKQLQDLEAAENVVQDVFVIFWEKRASLDIKHPKAYLYRSVNNRVLNIFKHQQVRVVHEAHERATADDSYEDGSLEGNELQWRLNKALDQLPDRCREVFELSRFQELKYQEIADELNISIKTVENQMGKALKILRQELKDYLPLLLFLLLK